MANKKLTQFKENFLSFFGFGRQTSEAKSDDNPLARAIKKIGFAKNPGNTDFQTPDFDLQQINDAYNSDSYVRQAIDKYNELMFKEGWDIVTQDDGVSEYMDKRVKMIGMSMGQPFESFLREVCDDLVKFSNVFIVKARKEPKDMPKVKGVNVKGLGDEKPVAAYFRLPPETMQIKVDKHGSIKKYKQVISGEEKQFRPEDIIHITYKKTAGKFFGLPMVLPALEDVKLLREVEDNVARLIYRHLYPLFIYRVGKAEPGYEATDEEIEDMQQEIRDMPTEGGLVVPERHDIDILGTNGEALDAEQYLDYFQKRVFTGLGVTETIMGRSATANRSTAENQSSELRDKVKAFQKVAQDSINFHIMRELLMEGGYDPIGNPDDKAFFKFKEIDTDLKIKRENQAIYKFEHNATTHEEMREELGKDPVQDEVRLHGNMFADEEDSKAETNNKTNPQNQHSQKQFLNKKLNCSVIENSLGGVYLDLQNETVDMIKCYCDGLEQKSELLEQIEEFTEKKKDKAVIHLDSSIRNSFFEGVNDGQDELFANNSKNIAKSSCKSYISKLQLQTESKLSEYFENLASKLKKVVNSDIEDRQELVSRILATFNVVEYKLLKSVRHILMLSYNYGYAKAGENSGFDKIYLETEEETKKISLSNNYIDKLPDYIPSKEYYLSYSKQKGGNQ